MLLDLFGRGYSDGVADLPHDSRLYSSQILIAVTSSILPWATEGFALIGYSLGGGIVVDFSTAFPSMVSGVVLLAPAGLIRRGHFGWMSRLLYSGLVPRVVVEGMIRRRLKGGVVPRSTDKVSIKSPENAVNAEIKGTEFESVELSKSRPGVTVAKAVQWQLFEHKGFVRSFVSSIMFASIAGTEEMKGGWRVLGAQRKERGDKVLVIAGARDNVIVEKELGEDVLECVGEENLEWRVIDGAGHEFPMTRAEEVVGMVSEVWGL
jgi:pimeloyl-ACP methyl ester carboxylesterase